MVKENSNLNCGVYESPSVKTLVFQSEGVLCGSYDSPGYGYDDANDLGEI